MHAGTSGSSGSNLFYTSLDCLVVLNNNRKASRATHTVRFTAAGGALTVKSTMAPWICNAQPGLPLTLALNTSTQQARFPHGQPFREAGPTPQVSALWWNCLVGPNLRPARTASVLGSEGSLPPGAIARKYALHALTQLRSRGASWETESGWTFLRSSVWFAMDSPALDFWEKVAVKLQVVKFGNCPQKGLWPFRSQPHTALFTSI